MSPADYNFPNATTFIQIISTVSGDPTPDIVSNAFYVEYDPRRRPSGATPGIIDGNLGFGSFVMTLGRAYVAPSEWAAGRREFEQVTERSASWGSNQMMKTQVRDRRQSGRFRGREAN